MRVKGVIRSQAPITEWEVYITVPAPPPVSEMTYTVSSGTLNSSIPYHTCYYFQFLFE